MNKLKELDVVILKSHHEKVKKGTKGTIVHVFDTLKDVYEVEFITNNTVYVYNIGGYKLKRKVSFGVWLFNTIVEICCWISKLTIFCVSIMLVSFLLKQTEHHVVIEYFLYFGVGLLSVFPNKYLDIKFGDLKI